MQQDWVQHSGKVLSLQPRGPGFKPQNHKAKGRQGMDRGEETEKKRREGEDEGEEESI